MKNEEYIYQRFATAPTPWFKYALDYNSVVDSRTTKRIIVYPWWQFSWPVAPPVAIVGNINMTPQTMVIQNETFGIIDQRFLASCLLSIKDRDTKEYAFVDMPLFEFVAQMQFHQNWHLKLNVDMKNSYMRFSSFPFFPANGMVVPFYFRLYDK